MNFSIWPEERLSGAWVSCFCLLKHLFWSLSGLRFVFNIVCHPPPLTFSSLFFFCSLIYSPCVFKLPSGVFTSAGRLLSSCHRSCPHVFLLFFICSSWGSYFVMLYWKVVLSLCLSWSCHRLIFKLVSCFSWLRHCTVHAQFSVSIWFVLSLRVNVTNNIC